MRKWDVMVQTNAISVSAQFDFWATGILDQDPMPPIFYRG
jgi:hypothetical protein